MYGILWITPIKKQKPRAPPPIAERESVLRLSLFSDSAFMCSMASMIQGMKP